jgi:hypothetical protein
MEETSHRPQTLVRNATVEKASVVTNEEQSARTTEKSFGLAYCCWCLE